MRGVALFTALLAAALMLSAGAQPALKPTIAVVDRTPVVVRGTGFGSRERVVVTVRSGIVRAMQRTTATYRGAFVVRFDGVRLTACTGATLVATGARGHAAQLKLELRECPGPIIDPWMDDGPGEYPARHVDR